MNVVFFFFVQETYSIMKVFNGELSEALINQVQFTFRCNCFEPKETKNITCYYYS